MIVRRRLSGFDTAADLCAGLAGLLDGVPKKPDRTQGLRDCPGHSGINRALAVQLARLASLPLGLRQGEHSFLFQEFSGLWRLNEWDKTYHGPARVEVALISIASERMGQNFCGFFPETET